MPCTFCSSFIVLGVFAQGLTREALGLIHIMCSALWATDLRGIASRNRAHHCETSASLGHSDKHFSVLSRATGVMKTAK